MRLAGPGHRAVLDRMGITEDVLALQTGGHDQTVIDAEGKEITVIPGEFTGGDIEILRGDLELKSHFQSMGSRPVQRRGA